VGTLLAASVAGGGGARPLIGMAAFATGLALPFFLLALFPSYLKRLPRSGGWLARVKVIIGFVVLAASLKYVSSVDQVLQWGFLTRERFWRRGSCCSPCGAVPARFRAARWREAG